MARHQELRVWQHSRILVQLVCSSTCNSNSAGDLVSQIRRAAISVASNIAEGSERGSDREFRRFLKIADGSNAEVQSLTAIAGDAGILSPTVVATILTHSASTGRQLGALLRAVSGTG
jgi:four helix bundle protein